MDQRVKINKNKKRDKFLERGWKSWKSEDESRLSKLQHCWDRLEYWEESWRLEKTCYHSDTRERPPALAGGEKLTRI